jgi:3-phosphoshikimate 1-carboxyvinyltransferase
MRKSAGRSIIIFHYENSAQGMKYIRIINQIGSLKGSVNLPASKSISNRALIIRALCHTPFIIQNLSDADDTVLVNNLFASGENELYVKNAGTVARFLLAYFASRPCDVVLTGSERMKERPIGDLVDALNSLGGNIEYTGEENHLPVHIYGKALRGGFVQMAADTSSQFISAMLLIAPTLKEGLTLELTGEIVSEPYINLTLQMMADFGIKYWKENNTISIPPQKYQSRTFFVESDWSSASYFFALAVLHPDSELVFDNLFENSWQGDHVITHLMGHFGVEISFKDRKCIISTGKPVISQFKYDFIDHPDLIPTFACLCCALEMPFELTGTRTLKYKESNRAEVLRDELLKAGYALELEENSIMFNGKKAATPDGVIFLSFKKP